MHVHALVIEMASLGVIIVIFTCVVKQQYFANNSLSLCWTSQEEKYQELVDFFRSQKSDSEKYLEWRHCGPPNKRLVSVYLLHLFFHLTDALMVPVA